MWATESTRGWAEGFVVGAPVAGAVVAALAGGVVGRAVSPSEQAASVVTTRPMTRARTAGRALNVCSEYVMAGHGARGPLYDGSRSIDAGSTAG
jgi:hypothetical protein